MGRQDRGDAASNQPTYAHQILTQTLRLLISAQRPPFAPPAKRNMRVFL